ncbi:DUF3558 family protein [Pseudonocardia sp. NPDC046786]|uniref:DUF3558 family protein n=1 Tax=Pseudonocardia sp. NPDC046786 TaxID=3155471 RepID=UPI0033D745DD
MRIALEWALLNLLSRWSTDAPAELFQLGSTFRAFGRAGGGPRAILWIFHRATEDDVGRSGWRGTTVLLVLLGIATAVAGCSADESAGPFPDRPRDIDVSRLDPCMLLGAPGRQVRGVGQGEADEQIVEGLAARSCSWNNFDNGRSYSVQLIGMEADRALGQGRVVETIAGYGAVRQTEFTDSAPMCALIVDVHSGQSMRVVAQSVLDVDGAPRPIGFVCDDAATLTAEILEGARTAQG